MCEVNLPLPLDLREFYHVPLCYKDENISNLIPQSELTPTLNKFFYIYTLFNSNDKKPLSVVCVQQNIFV